MEKLFFGMLSFGLLFGLSMNANATQYICNSPILDNSKPLDVYHINTDKKYLKHYQHGIGGYALLRLITPIQTHISYLTDVKNLTTDVMYLDSDPIQMISIKKDGYSSYLMKHENEKNYKFTDSYAEHKDFICESNP